MKIVYDPTHPDADEDGYLELPNVDMVKEMADAMAATPGLRLRRHRVQHAEICDFQRAGGRPVRARLPLLYKGEELP